jgi:hypothetical protein
MRLLVAARLGGVPDLVRHALADSSPLARYWAISEEDSFFVPPMPPLGGVVVGQPIPISLSAKAFWPLEPGPLSPGGRARRKAERSPLDGHPKYLGHREKGKLNGRVCLSSLRLPRFPTQCANPGIAKAHAGKTARRHRRDIPRLAGYQSIQERWDDFSRRSAPMKILTNAVFGHLFLFAPWLIWQAGPSTMLAGAAIGIARLDLLDRDFLSSPPQDLLPGSRGRPVHPFLIILLSPGDDSRAIRLPARFEGFGGDC